MPYWVSSGGLKVDGGSHPDSLYLEAKKSRSEFIFISQETAQFNRRDLY